MSNLESLLNRDNNRSSLSHEGEEIELLNPQQSQRPNVYSLWPNIYQCPLSNLDQVLSVAKTYYLRQRPLNWALFIYSQPNWDFFFSFCDGNENKELQPEQLESGKTFTTLLTFFAGLITTMPS